LVNLLTKALASRQETPSTLGTRAHRHHQLQPHHQLHIERLCVEHQEEQEEGNKAQMLVKELQVNNEVANILLELGDVNEAMLIDEEQQEQEPYHDNEPILDDVDDAETNGDEKMILKE